MATKAEKFRSETERAGAKKPKAPRKPRRDVQVDTAKPKTSATDRKAGGSSTAARNRSKKAAGKAGAALEDSVASKRPSRKSTRKSANRSKRDTNLSLRETRKVTSPKARARRAIAKKKPK